MNCKRSELKGRLSKIQKLHGEAYRSGGDYQSLNEELGSIRKEIDEEWGLNTLGIIGNDKLLQILKP